MKRILYPCKCRICGKLFINRNGIGGSQIRVLLSDLNDIYPKETLVNLAVVKLLDKCCDDCVTKVDTSISFAYMAKSKKFISYKAKAYEQFADSIELD